MGYCYACNIFTKKALSNIPPYLSLFLFTPSLPSLKNLSSLSEERETFSFSLSFSLTLSFSFRLFWVSEKRLGFFGFSKKGLGFLSFFFLVLVFKPFHLNNIQNRKQTGIKYGLFFIKIMFYILMLST